MSSGLVHSAYVPYIKCTMHCKHLSLVHVKLSDLHDCVHLLASAFPMQCIFAMPNLAVKQQRWEAMMSAASCVRILQQAIHELSALSPTDAVPGLKPSGEADHSGTREQPAKVYSADGEETEDVAAVGSASDGSNSSSASDTRSDTAAAGPGMNGGISDRAAGLQHSRQESNKHASTSEPDDAATDNGNKGGKGSSTSSSIRSHGSSSNNGRSNGSGRERQSENGRSNGSSHDSDEDSQKERVKQAISVASSKMQRITEQDDAGQHPNGKQVCGLL